MNLKEELFQQIAYGIIYRKMLVWKDLNIIGNGTKNRVEHGPQSKFELH